MHFQPKKIHVVFAITCTAAVHTFQFPWPQLNTVGMTDQLKQYYLYEGRRDSVFSNGHF